MSSSECQFQCSILFWSTSSFDIVNNRTYYIVLCFSNFYLEQKKEGRSKEVDLGLVEKVTEKGTHSHASGGVSGKLRSNDFYVASNPLLQ